MTLTSKLVLGFLFALVLQVAQMSISSYFTAQMQAASVQVAGALTASMAVQSGLDAVGELRKRAALDAVGRTSVDATLYGVYTDELSAQLDRLSSAFDVAAHPAFRAAREKADALLPRLAEIGKAVRSGDAEQREDAFAFLDDAAQDAEQALLQAQLHVRALANEGVRREQAVHDLPMRASIAITLAGVVLMTVFVAWFSRQLVIPIERAWAALEGRVQERTAELARTVTELQSQIVERERAEAKTRELHQQLVETSRRAGMAELANGVLHNVGNVLNSVNVSTNVLLQNLQKSKADGLQRVVDLIRAHETDLAEFLTRSAQGQKLPPYLRQLAAHMLHERDLLVDETRHLSEQIDHMKEIVSRQQAYARVSGTTSRMRLGQVVDDVVAMNAHSFQRDDIRLVRRLESDDEREVDRSRVMQVLMNLVSNAKHALRARGGGGGVLEIAVTKPAPDRVRVAVADNGVGIAADNLTRIFAHGFTTRPDGHGFGLHHSANAAAEMGGRLWAESAGEGKGATFVLELPDRSTMKVTT